MLTTAAYRRALDAVALEFMRFAQRLVRSFIRGPQTKDDYTLLVDMLHEAVSEARRRQGVLAQQYLSDQMAAQRVSGEPYVPEVRNYDRRATDKAVSTALKQPENAETLIPKRLQVHVEDAPRRVVQDSVRVTTGKGKRPLGWARVLTGADNCGFCVVLASRGMAIDSEGRFTDGFYTSQEKALFAENGEKYHPNCDCVAVPVWRRGSWDGFDQAKELYELYKASRRKHVDNDPPESSGYKERAPDAFEAVRRELRDRPDLLNSIVPDLRARD